MRPKHLVSIVLIAVVLVMLMRNNNSMTNARPLVYRESLDEVAAQINGETLTLRDMAFYVGYEEYQIQQEALVYDPDDPNRYWSMRVEGGFMNAVARKNAMQMTAATELPMMNMRPPMVGVPCLFLCQLGPTSRMVWPNLILCRNGTMK